MAALGEECAIEFFNRTFIVPCSAWLNLAQINAEIIYPLFEKRFPGIKINHVDATSDKLAARVMKPSP